MSALDDVISTVLRAREDGPDALAAVALSFGAAMELGTLGNAALKARLAATRAALEATEATVTTLRTERDAARDTAAQAAEVSAQATRDWDAAFNALCTARSDRDAAQAEAKAARDERDAAREALAARDSAPDLDYPARAEVWRLREVVEAHRTRAEKAEAERDAAVQERESFSLRLSAALRERDEARAELDLARESAREAREEIAQSLALVDEARAALDAALARPTYESRTVAPTRPEQDRHKASRGRWLVTWQERHAPALRSDVVAGVWPPRTYPVGAVYLPLDASGLPCAWPVVP